MWKFFYLQPIHTIAGKLVFFIAFYPLSMSVSTNSSARQLLNELLNYSTFQLVTFRHIDQNLT